MLLAGKKVVVVGGSSGIGLATAEMAKREGAEIIVASRNVERLDKAAEKLNAIAIPTDVTSDDSVAKLFQRCGPVDHVVVTAAQLRTGPFKTVAMEDVRATMEGKFWGAWRVAQRAEIRAGGSLTLVSGFLSVRPRPNSAIVSAANGALESLSRALALELAPVRVNAVSPRSAPRCRNRRDAICWRKLRRRCPSAASVRLRISRGRSSVSWPTALRPDRSSISMAGRW
jgi:NAD(P)-dependent dehydrogenase (short-subunit alcohol dehydrogenase family)